MLFNSLQFLLFFPLVTILFFVAPKNLKLPLLLAASCYFYAVFIPKFLLILFFLIIVDYLAGLLIERAPLKKKKLFLVVSLIANLGVLGLFKYFDFFNANLGQVARLMNFSYTPSSLKLILPIGLSFHTFQSMAYTIEVYKGKFKAEKNLLVYSIYVLFYPQMVAGPIERPQHLLPQLSQEKQFDFDRLFSGMKLMAWGFFKKVFVADRLALYANDVFNNSTFHGSKLSLLIGVYFFSFQIYCDFSGYTDIARGAAHAMGFNLIENFRSPYLATSVGEFWHRWHISLSTWFRDYLYIPLGGSKRGSLRNSFNIMLVFLLSGLWHGANWTFVIWGFLHGFYLVTARGLSQLKFYTSIRWPTWLKRLVTFHLVTLGWIFFRAKDVSSAFQVIRYLALQPLQLKEWVSDLKSNELILTGLFSLLLFGLACLIRERHRSWQGRWEMGKYELAFQAIGIALLVNLILLGAPLNETAFIYFQF